MMLDQQEFYSRHKRKHGYKYQSVVTPDSFVSSLMGSFMGQRGDWKMVKPSGLAEKLRTVNRGCQAAHALYFYEDPAYSTIYGIMGLYKNFPSRSCTPAQDLFSKIMSRLQIEVEHGFVIHQNLWTWNGFHLGLKPSQRAEVCYAVSVFLASIWTCMQDNQTSVRFTYAPQAFENYLELLADIYSKSDLKLESSDSDQSLNSENVQ